MDELITLVSQTFSQNAMGVQVPTETSTQIWARVTSITRAEWFNAGQNGLQPSFEVITPIVNYNGEKIVEIRGKRYGVYRTYHEEESDEIELYLEEKVGTNG